MFMYVFNWLRKFPGDQNSFRGTSADALIVESVFRVFPPVLVPVMLSGIIPESSVSEIALGQRV